MIGRQRIRHASRQGDVYVITEARWPVGPNFERDKAFLFAQMRLEFEARMRTQPVAPLVHLMTGA